MPGRKSKISIQISPAEREHGVAATDTDRPSIGSPARALGQGPIDHHPAVAPVAIPMPDGELQSTAASVYCLRGAGQVSGRMCRLIVR
jgi:hypothetical protein